MTDKYYETIQYLNQAFYMDKRINALLAEKEINISLATRCTANYNSGSNNQRQNSMEKILSRIIDQEKEIDEEIDRLTDLRKEIVAVIEKLPNDGEKSILRMRYLAYMPLAKIAGIMGCDRRTIQRKHKSAIVKLSEGDYEIHRKL